MPRESPHDETITVAQVPSLVQALRLFSGDVCIVALNENNYQYQCKKYVIGQSIHVSFCFYVGFGR